MNRFLTLLRLAFLAGGWLAVARLEGAPTASRSLPVEFSPGVPFEVTVSVLPDPAQQVQALYDTPPTGWAVSSVSHGGSLDPLLGRVKWGPFLDALPRTLTYRLTPPGNASGIHSFQGEASFDALTVPLTGPAAIQRFPGTFTRSQPAHYLPGSSLDVSLDAAPAPDVEVWAVEEAVPRDWTVSNISSGGVLDPLSHTVKWGPFLDAAPRVLSYTLTPPSTARLDASLTANARFGEATLLRTAPLPLVPSRLERSVPARYRPGIPLTNTLTATPAPYVQVFALEEQLAPGWIPEQVSTGGTFDPASHTLRWGPFLDAQARSFSYRLIPAAGSESPLPLMAIGRFDDRSSTSSVTVLRHLDNPVSQVVRSLPVQYQPGVPFPVSLQAIPIDTARVYALEEVLPPGWIPSALSAGGAWDALNQTLKWGPFFDDTATVRTLSYELTAPTNAFGTVAFSGSARFDGTVVVTTGESTLGHAPPQISRTAPARFTAGVPLSVTLTLEPVPGVEIQAVEELVPPGWIPSGLTDGGSVDPNSGRLKWGPFIDRNRRTLTYALLPPSGASGTRSLSGTGHFNRDAVPTAGSSALTPNSVPVVAPLSGPFRPGQTAKFPLLRLLAAASDADGDLLRIASVTATSDAGGQIFVLGAFLSYTPPAGQTSIDHARFRIADAFGGSVEAVLDLVPTAASGEPTRALISLTSGSGGVLNARFAGVPGRHYRIQVASSLDLPIAWVDLACATADSGGQVRLLDTPPPGPASRYYRLLPQAVPCN